MNVLVTGGSDALQHSIVEACVAAGHAVRVIRSTSHATSKPWPAGVEPLAVADATPDTLRRFLRGCDTVTAVSPALSPSLRTTHEATMHSTLEAAGAAGIGRLILVTGLNDRSVVGNGFPMDHLVIRSASPYGVGDDPITLFLILMRALPVVPLLPDSSVIRPVWHADLARCVAASLAMPSNMSKRVITIAGREAVTPGELYARIAKQIDRHPLRLPVPDFLVSYVGLDRLIGAGAGEPDNGPLADFIRTPLNEGLQQMIRDLPEVTPEEGVGALQVKTFSTTIHTATHAPAVMSLLRARFADVMPVPVGTEPAVPARTLSLGSVHAIALPGRGHVQVRVVDMSPTETTLATLRGHTVAGIVRFSAAQAADGVRFQVMTCDRAANAADWLALSLGGARLQDANWMTVVKNVAAAAGEAHADVHLEARRLVGIEARRCEDEIASLLQHHHREHDGPDVSPPAMRDGGAPAPPPAH